MKRPPLLFFFVLALLSLLFGTVLFPSIRFITFAPFFALVFQRKNLLTSLWIAAGCGLLVDVLSYDLRFGVFSLCSLITAALTHQLNRYFFEELLHSIPLYTLVISIAFSAIQFFFIQVGFNFQLALSSLFFMPLIDALYGFIWFTCPRMLYCLVIKKRENQG